MRVERGERSQEKSGTRKVGRRLKLPSSSSIAGEFEGDPWANAAAAGYLYPKYTGWGTKFQKRKATVVDSSRFLKPKMVEPDERGFFESKELTKVHQRLNQTIRRAGSQEREREREREREWERERERERRH